MKNYVKSIISSNFMYLDANNLYRREMSQELSLNGFKRMEGLSQFNEDFIKSYDENSDKIYIFEVELEYQSKII